VGISVSCKQQDYQGFACSQEAHVYASWIMSMYASKIRSKIVCCAIGGSTHPRADALICGRINSRNFGQNRCVLACMYVCRYVCMYVCALGEMVCLSDSCSFTRGIYIYIYIHTYIHTYMSTDAHTHTHTHKYFSLCICRCNRASAKHTQICIYIYAYVHI